jgi:TRAP-type uncharacterized transport system substrate-binding protein
MPPRTVAMATDAEGGVYSATGQRYQAIFSRHGVHLELLHTAGSVENLERLQAPQSGVSVTLVQGGITSGAKAPELVSLGTVFYEPFWLFTRVATSDPSKALREGMRLSFGVSGSGTDALARELAAGVGFDLSRAEVVHLGTDEAGKALLRGELDFIGMSMGWEAPIVQQLLREESIHPVDWPRADAHVALRPYLSKLVLPRGVADLARDRPSRDLTLLATTASLEERVNQMRVPSAFAHMLYTLKIHIGLVRERLQAAQPAEKSR